VPADVRLARVFPGVARSFDHLKGLDGISDSQLAEHLDLYAGYVKQVNSLTQELSEVRNERRASGKDFGLAEGNRAAPPGRRTGKLSGARSRRRSGRSTTGRRTSRRWGACGAWAG